MSLDPLVAALTEAARLAFTQMREENPGEVFYCFALFTSDLVTYVNPAAGGEQGLRRIAAEQDTTEEELRWSPADWPCFEVGQEHFAEVDRLLKEPPDPYDLDAEDGAGQRFDALVSALAALDGEGFFGRAAERDRVLVTVLSGDESDRTRLAVASLLNPPAAVERFAADLDVPDPAGDYSTLGAEPVYQVWSMAYAPDGLTLVAAAGDELYAWDLRHGNELPAISGDSFRQVAISWDGGLLVAAEGPEVVAVDLRSGSRTRIGTGGDASLAVSPDGAMVIAGSHAEIVTAFEVSSGRLRWQQPGLVTCLRFAPGGDLVAMAGDRVVLVDPASGTPRHEVQAARPGAQFTVEWSGDGRSFATGDWQADGTIRLWHWQDGQAVPGPVLSPPDGTDDPGLDGTSGLAFSPDGSLLASVHGNGDLHLWEVGSGRHLRRLRGLQESLEAVVFLDDEHVAAAGTDVDLGPPVYVWTL